MHLLFHARPMPEQIPFTPMKYLHKKKKKKKKINPKQTGGCENINKNDRDIW